MSEKESLLRSIPQVSELLEKLSGKAPLPILKRAIREVLAEVREEILQGKRKDLKDLRSLIERRIKRLSSWKLKRVVNATGVVINTNLGRAPLPPEAVERALEIAQNYCNLEYDLGRGKRGSRLDLVRELLTYVTGGEDAIVVNNNAGAVFLVLKVLAEGREVIISRGELVEIGGSFRIPDIMASSGAVLVEVGTTNKTRIQDYERAITENTALIMKVHKSNFYMEGFTEEVGLKDLSRVAREKNLVLYYDAGSGLIERFPSAPEEITFKDAIKQGADLVSGSGDKLFGGPQAGIIAGKKDLIEKLKKHPLMRVLRVDKITLSLLEAVLRLYVEGRKEDIPVLRMLSENEESIKKRAKKLLRKLKNMEGITCEIVKDRAKPGGGALPKLELPTYCLKVSAKDLSEEDLACRLRNAKVPVVGRISKGSLLLDMRTVRDEEIDLIVRSFREALSKDSERKG